MQTEKNAIETHKVPELHQPIRLSDYCCGIFELLPTRKGVKKAIKNHRITVDKKMGRTGDWIKGGESIELYRAENAIKSYNTLPLPVIYEDDQLAIINKPAGISVSGNLHRTIINALPNCLITSLDADVLVTPLPVHRLDYATSGILLIAKTHTSVRFLTEQFKQRKIHKEYHAVIIGSIDQVGSSSSPINSKPSTTHWEVINSTSSKRFNTLSLLKVTPVTGRKHQIRLHLSELGNSILGDQKYPISSDLILKGHGLYLQATRIKFVHPKTLDEMSFEIPLHKKFTSIFS